MSLRVGFATFSGAKVVSRSMPVPKGSRYNVSFRTPLEPTLPNPKPKGDFAEATLQVSMLLHTIKVP